MGGIQGRFAGAGRCGFNGRQDDFLWPDKWLAFGLITLTRAWEHLQQQQHASIFDFQLPIADFKRAFRNCKLALCKWKITCVTNGTFPCPSSVLKFQLWPQTPRCTVSSAINPRASATARSTAVSANRR
jgi:hypothetical protein